ncbi:MAG: D-2-hydroxyacid dehydrogenase [Clostridiaceae bacterium]|nr:D-2-hydroxyacid dehydrogenase [Clostridiaceae bacterium]
MKNILIDVVVDQKRLEELRAIPGVNVEVIDYKEERRVIPPEIIRDKHILFCTFPPENFKDMKTIEFIQINSTGYTQLFSLGLAEKGVKACNAQGTFDVPIAEWNIAMMINLFRDFKGIMRNQDARVWDRAARFQKEIRGSIAGIWGYGSIGRETARLAKALGMKVYAMDRDVPSKVDRTNIYRVEGTGDPEGVLPDKIFTSGQEKDFLKELDFLIITMPLTNKTKGMIGEEELKSLPRTAYLLNPSRAHIIKEEALLRALEEGWIAGAALDVHYYYPMPPEHPLWSFPNVIMTPHISGSTLSTLFIERTWDIFVENVRRFLSNKPLLNQLSPSQLRGE